MIDLNIFSDQERRRQLITRYWKLSPNGKDFAEPMNQIKEDFGLSRGAVLGIVRSGCRAVSQIHVCKCGHRKEFDSRKDFRSTPTQKPYVCEECRDERSDGDLSAEGANDNASRIEPLAEKPGENLFEDIGLWDDIGLQEDSRLGDVGSSMNAGKSPALSGREEKRLRQRLRSLARGLSRASQRLERLSRQINTFR